MGQRHSTPAPPPTAPTIPMGHLMPPPPTPTNTPGDHPRTPSDAHGPGATQGQPVTFATGMLVAHATPPRPEGNISLLEVGTDDVNRHKHDGTQPKLMKAAPSHKAGVEWTIKH